MKHRRWGHGRPSLPGPQSDPGGTPWPPHPHPHPRPRPSPPSCQCSPSRTSSPLLGSWPGYTGLTREAYALDLRQYASWCQQHHIRLFQARRADIECFARDLEARGRARATITCRPCTIAGFYKYAVEEDLLDHSPAAHVRRPRLDYESHATVLDRNELGALLARPTPTAPASRRCSPPDGFPQWVSDAEPARCTTSPPPRPRALSWLYLAAAADLPTLSEPRLRRRGHRHPDPRQTAARPTGTRHQHPHPQRHPAFPALPGGTRVPRAHRPLARP